MRGRAARAPRRLVVVLGDQLDRDSAAFDGFDPERDRVWMAEVREESSHVPSTKPRTAVFLAAMRHFRDELRERGVTVAYRELGDGRHRSLADALTADLATMSPAELRWVRPGDWRVRESLTRAAAESAVPLVELDDRHFISSPEEFAQWANGRREWRLEYYYRHLRRRTGILMNGDAPEGGAWNFDKENRSALPAAGPPGLSAPRAFPPDALTRAVIAEVDAAYPDRAGDLRRFDWPVTPAQADEALTDFIRERLPLFGRYQDALWRGEPYLYHSRLSAALNLKLIAPSVVIRAAVTAYRDGHAPLAAVEGFVRQILGWREYVRGVYWHEMPGYADGNALDAREPLPGFYWTGETACVCLREAIGQTLTLGYAHHIQRLMVTGLYALLLGVAPREIHAWYLAVYVDAVEWAELPNVVGMSQYADGGRVASKPYIASGRYIERMSNYCATCPFRPGEAVGPRACPFTTLYWDFLDRHSVRFARHPRLGQHVRHLMDRSPAERAAIRAAASALRDGAP